MSNVRLIGACGGCQMVSMTLRHGIKQVLKVKGSDCCLTRVDEPQRKIGEGPRWLLPWYQRLVGVQKEGNMHAGEQASELVIQLITRLGLNHCREHPIVFDSN